ncbi:hypothetical protein D3C85_1354040 [compost metagenome]
MAAGRQHEVDADSGVELVAVVEADHRAEVGVANAAFVVVRTVLDVQAYVVERQQRMESQVAAQHLLLGNPDEARHDGGDAQVDVGRLVSGVIAQGVGKVVADEHLSVGPGGRKDTHSVYFDPHRPGRHTTFGGLGWGGGSGQQHTAGDSKGSGVKRVLVHGKANLVVIGAQLLGVAQRLPYTITMPVMGYRKYP